MSLRLNIVTLEGRVYCGDVDIVIVPNIEGQLGILPNHALLLTSLTQGEFRVRRGGEEETFAISGGLIEVKHDQVIVSADVAEHAEGIDVERAETARRRAEGRFSTRVQSNIDFAWAEAALRRAMTCIESAKLRRRKGGRRLAARQIHDVSDELGVAAG